MHLTPTTLKIYNKSSSNYTQIDLNFATRIERVENPKSQWCFCIDALGPRVCISLRSDKELNEWMNDVYLSSSLSSRCTMPLSVVHHVHCQEDPKSGRLVGLPAEWRAHPLLESLPARSSTLSVNVVGLHPPPGGLFGSHVRSKSDGNLDAVNGSVGHSSHIGGKLKCLRWAESSDDAAESLYEAYGNRTESIVARKQRIYQNFFALLLEEISMDSSYAKQRALLRLQELFRSVAALDCVSSLLESSDYRDELLDIWREVGNISDQRVYDALEKDEGELLRLLQAVSVSTSATEMVLSLRGRRAQQFMDIVQDVLSYPNPQQPTSTQLRLRLLYLVTKLSQYCGYQPASLSISDVSCDASEPRFSGSFGDVFLASLHGVPVALKRMRPIWTSLNLDDIEAMRQKHCREALIWQHLSHPNLLTFIGIDNKTFHPTPCLVSPWMENGTVMSYLRKHQGVNVAQLLSEVAQGLEYLHSMKVCHGDLRGSNVLVDNDGHARIADFGLVPLYALASAGEYSGSLRWTAPEVIRSKIHGNRRLKRMPAGDIYSFGCLCVELYNRQPPFDGISEVNVVMLILDGIPPPRPVEMEDEMWTLVQDCLCPDLCNRPRASVLVGRMGATKTLSI